MKSLLLISFSICLSYLMIGCGSDSHVEARLSTVCSLLDTDPDSALVILHNLDKAALSSSAKARYALLHVMAQDKSGIDVTDDSLLSIARHYYDNRTEDTFYSRFCYYQGKYYALLDSMKQAESYLRDAIHSSEAQGDKYTAYLACYQLSRILSINNPRQGLAYSRKALSLYESMEAVKIGNEIELLRKVGNSHYMLDENDSALYYMNRALSLSNASGDSLLCGRINQSISQIQSNMGRSDSALYYARQAWNVSSERDPSLYTQLAISYLGQDSLDKAELLLKEALQLPASIYTRYTVYNRLLSICLTRTENQEAKEYSDSVQVLLKRLYYSSESANASFLNDNHELEKEMDEIETQFSHSLQYSITVIILLAIIAIQILYNYQSFRKHAKIRLEYERKRHEQELKISEDAHQKELEIARLKQEKEMEVLNLKTAHRERQQSLMKEYFLLKSRYTRDCEGFKSKLKKNDLQDEDWLELEIFLNETYSNFMILFRNRHPDLTEIDYRDCMLLKTGLTNFEMERFYGISLTSVKQRLVRLRNKLGLDLKDMSAREYIEEFSQGEKPRN